ncbi:hypothetical protein CGLAUT_03765 [Corynebacterium glaucum]|nr:hypothetical protein CGLAUT_03765 [Corynebacterium glaucum]
MVPVAAMSTVAVMAAVAAVATVTAMLLMVLVIVVLIVVVILVVRVRLYFARVVVMHDSDHIPLGGIPQGCLFSRWGSMRTRVY